MLFKLAVKELTFDRMMSICQIAAIASIIAPLLLLFSLRYGILEELKENLMNDPKVLSLTLDTSYRLNNEFFKRLESNKHVGFVIPEITALNALVDIKFKGNAKKVETIPTKIGDPIVLGSNIPYSDKQDALGDHEVFINESLAHQRNLQVGESIQVVISRTQHGQRQASTLALTIKGIIGQRFVRDDCLLVNLDVLNAIDDFRNGYNPALLTDGHYKPSRDRVYAKFRLYAKNLESVTPLYYNLVEQHLNVTSKMREIENVKAIGKVLNFVFGVIALVSIIGGMIALTGLILSSLKARKRNLVLLQLMGQTRSNIYLIVIIELLLVALIGFALAFSLYYVGSSIFNDYFHALIVGTFISKLSALHILAFLGGACLLSILVAIWSTKYVILKMQIADVLREA